MDLRALKSSDKRVKSGSFQNFPCKIPIPYRSPTKKMIKQIVTNTIVCSTPLNAAKRNVFHDDNQQMSPIRYTSSATTSGNSSPLKLVDEKEIEKKLEISKINKIVEKKQPVKTENSVPSKKEMEESLHPFPLVNNVQVIKMIICDSEEDTIPTKLGNTKSKRGRKADVSNFATSNTGKLRKSPKRTLVIDKISKENTRSKTKTTHKINVISNKNSPEKIHNESSMKTTHSKSTSFPIINEIDQNEFMLNVELDNCAIPCNTNEKINKDISNGKTKNSVKLNNNEKENKIIKNDVDSVSDENNIIVNSDLLPKNNSKNRKTNKDILNVNVLKTKQSNLQILDVSNSTKSTVVLHSSMLENEKTNSNVKQIQDNSKNDKCTELKKRGRKPKTVNSKGMVNINDVSNTANTNIVVNESSMLENKITNSNIKQISDNTNNLEIDLKKSGRKPKIVCSNVMGNSNDVSNSIKSTIIEHKGNILENKAINSMVEQTPDNSKYVKSSEPKKRGRKSKTKVTDNIIVRKSTRKRTSGSAKFWRFDKQEKTLKKNKSISKENMATNKILLRKYPRRSKKIKVIQTNDLPISKDAIEDVPEEIKTIEVQEDNKPSKPTKKPTTTRKTNSKLLIPAKIIKPLVSNCIEKSPKISIEKQNESKLIASDSSYTNEEENEIPIDTLLSHVTKVDTNTELQRENGQKRKTKNNYEINDPKKVRLQSNSQYSFKDLAIAANITSQGGGLADVQIAGNRCLLECFGKYPRQYNCVSPQNLDLSIGVSINNGHITTGVIEIAPSGRKNYEYAKKVDLLFLVLEGIAEVGVGNSSQVLRIGQNFYVPKDTPYYMVNVSNTDKLVIYFCKIYK